MGLSAVACNALRGHDVPTVAVVLPMSALALKTLLARTVGRTVVSDPSVEREKLSGSKFLGTREPMFNVELLGYLAPGLT